jgi:hypothetical protein
METESGTADAPRASSSVDDEMEQKREDADAEHEMADDLADSKPSRKKRRVIKTSVYPHSTPTQSGRSD